MATRDDVLTLIGQDIEAFREATGTAQQDIADLFGRGRDWLSKVENATNHIKLVDYLQVMVKIAEEARGNRAMSAKAREEIENHPAILLAEYVGLIRKPRAK